MNSRIRKVLLLANVILGLVALSAKAQTTISITSQPADVTRAVGSSGSMSVSVTGGSPYTYQWYFQNAPIPGAIANRLSFSGTQAAQAGGYQVVVANAAGSVTSRVATLTVYQAPVITQEPLDQTAPVNSTVTLSVTATAVPAPTYQWKFNGTLIPGATSPELVLPAVTSANAGDYVVFVTNPYGDYTSSTAKLQVSYPPVISSQPSGLVMEAGSSDKFYVSASAISALSYQWYFNGAALTGATNQDLLFENLQPAQSGFYGVIVSNDAGATTSEEAYLNVYVKPVFTQQPVEATVAQHQSITFTAVATGVPAPAYQWFKGSTPILGANGSSFAIHNAQVTDMADYSVIASNPYDTVTSANAALTVTAPPAITAEPADAFIPYNAKGEFAVTAIGTGPLVYQWFWNGAAIAGANSADFSVDHVFPANTGSYSVRVSNAYGSVMSRAASLDVFQIPVFTLQPLKAQTNAVGSTVTLTAAATAIPPVTLYRWYLNSVPIPGATGPSLTLTNLTGADGGNFTVEALNLYGATMSKDALIRADLPALPFMDNFGNRKAILGLSGAGYGDNRLCTYELYEPSHYGRTSKRSTWLKWVAPTNGVMVIDTAGSSFNTVLAAYTGSKVDALTRVTSDDDSAGFANSRIVFNAAYNVSYSLVVAGRPGDEKGDVFFSWTFYPTETRLPVITSQPVDVSVTAGSPVTLAVAYGSNNAPVLVQWFFESQPIADATNNTYTIPALDGTQIGRYRAELACGGFTFSTRTVEVQINTEGLANVIAQNRADDASDSGINGWNAPTAGLRRRITAVSGYSGSQVFATRSGKDPGEPNHCGVVGGSSYWLSYVPASKGVLRLNTDGSTYDTIVAVYVDDGLGNGYASLLPVGCNDNGGANGLASKVDLSVTNGVTYYIVVDGKNGAYGTATLNYLLTANPTISTVAAVTINEDAITAPLAFTIGDLETSAASLFVAATSSNPTKVPNANLTLGGSGASRTLTVRPATNQNGTVSISLVVTDAHNQKATNSFTVTITPVNDAPVAGTDTVYRLANLSVSIPISTLLANDTDVDGTTSVFNTVASMSFQGAPVAKSGNFINYTAVPGKNTPDYFTYTIIDPSGVVATGRVNVYVQ